MLPINLLAVPDLVGTTEDSQSHGPRLKFHTQLLDGCLGFAPDMIQLALNRLESLMVRC